MHHTFLRYIRRVLVGIIVLVTLAVLANYFHSRYFRSRTEPKELAILGSEMVQSARSIEYSRYHRDGTLRFKIIARELKETLDGKNFLQGIQAFDFNPDETVHSEIRSRNAEYDEKNKTVFFTGDVQLLIGKEIELQTESLHYDLQTDIGTTRDLVKFFSEGITGEARGLYYDLGHKSLNLDSDVDFLIDLAGVLSDGSGSDEKLRAVSNKAFCYENLSRIEFQGDAQLESESLLLIGNLIEADIDTDLKEITSLESTGNAQYRSRTGDESRILRGDRMLFNIHPEIRSLEKIYVSGHAAMDFISPDEERRLLGKEIDLFLDPEMGMPTRVDARVGVELRMKRETEQTLISGEKLQAVFNPEIEGLKSIDVFQRAKISMFGPEGLAGDEIGAEKIVVRFRESGSSAAFEGLRAEGSAQWIYRPEQGSGTADASSYGKLSASLMDIFYSEESGFMDRIDASGKVVMTGANTGSKDAPQTRRLSADQVRFHFYPSENNPKDMYAEGHVLIIFDGGPEPGSSGMSEGFRTSSERMKAEFSPEADVTSISQWGNFKYEEASRSAESGRGDYDVQSETMRLTDSPEVVFEMGSAKGEIVEFNRESGVVRITGKVWSSLSNSQEDGLMGGTSSDSPNIVLADEMQYLAESGQALYSGNVTFMSEENVLQSDVLRIRDRGAGIEAEGNVRHRITRNQASGAEKGLSGLSSVLKPKEAENSPDMPIYIKSSELRYEKADKLLIYRGNVSFRKADLFLTSEILEAVLNEESRLFDRATARNNVEVQKGNRKCKGDIAYYYLNPERFEVIGDQAEFYDPELGWTLVTRLTYIVDDDSIELEQR